MTLDAKKVISHFTPSPLFWLEEKKGPSLKLCEGLLLPLEKGVVGAQVDEVWSLDDLENKKPIYGIIFLFKWTPGVPCQGKVIDEGRHLDVYFTKQVINNACATQALLSILLNINDPNIQLGDTLTSFKTFTQTFDPVSRGIALSNSDTIRMVHNSFAKPSLIEFDEKGVSKKDEDVFHYVVYVPCKGRLYELDGLQDGPIDHGAVGEDWVSALKPILNSRIEDKGGLLYNLMVLTSDRKKFYETKIVELTELGNSNQRADDTALTLCDYEALLSQEIEKREMYKIENIRRRHNYIPFVVEFFKILAEKGELTGLMEKAKAKAKERSSSEAAKKSAEASKS